MLGRVKPGHPCCPSEMNSDRQRGWRGQRPQGGQGETRPAEAGTCPPSPGTPPEPSSLQHLFVHVKDAGTGRTQRSRRSSTTCRHITHPLQPRFARLQAGDSHPWPALWSESLLEPGCPLRPGEGAGRCVYSPGAEARCPCLHTSTLGPPQPEITPTVDFCLFLVLFKGFMDLF